MNEEEMLTMINKRGRIIRVDKRNLKSALEEGLRIFPNPKEEYYPEYDEDFNKLAPDEPLPNEQSKDTLEVIVI